MEPLFSDGICLRPFEARDVPAFVEAARESQTTVGRWMHWCHINYSKADAESWFARTFKNQKDSVAYELGIFTPDSQDFLGGIGLNQLNREHNFCNLGFWVREPRQRQGIATRAACALAEFGFRELKLTRIEIVMAEANIPSRRVAEKTGATFECVARNRLVINGSPHAATVYSLVPGQCERSGR